MYKAAFNRLPDRFRKPNNKALYDIAYGNINGLKQAVDSVRESRDIDKAFGQTLDYIGANVGQYRTDEDDNLFRLLIKTRIIANLSRGDMPTINEVSKVLLGDAFVGVEEAWNSKDFKYEPAAIIFHLKPDKFKLHEKPIARIVAGGVGVKWVMTFDDNRNHINIAAVTLSGTDTTVYPEMMRDIELETVAFVGAGHGLQVNNTVIGGM